MSSSRSVAAARARRSNESAQYPPRPTGPGHSIHSSANFAPPSQANNGYRQPPPAVAQTKQPSYVPPQSQNTFESQSPSYANPPYPSKVTIQDAIGVLSTRIARLESFMHKYNLETPGVANTNNGHQQQPNKGSQIDDSLLKNIMARLDSLEKEKRSASSTSAPNLVAHINHSTEIQQMNQQLNQVKEELKDTSKMLTTLQSFTMETNQKLVTLLFQDTNDMQVDSYSETMFDNEDAIALDTTEINEIEVNIQDGQFSSGSLKDSINEELSKLAL
jgi:hypothetical protein